MVEILCFISNKLENLKNLKLCKFTLVSQNEKKSITRGLIVKLYCVFLPCLRSSFQNKTHLRT